MNELEVTLPNGYTIQLFEHEGNLILGLINTNGYYVSDTKLSEVEINTLKQVIKGK